MKAEKQVCTLEQANEFKKSGIAQGKSLFQWREYKYGGLLPHLSFGNWSENEHRNLIGSDAFTVAELGLMLPTYFNTYASMPMKTDHSMWTCFEYRSDKDDPMGDGYIGATEAEARAAVVIDLLRHGKVKVEDINQRLNS